MKQITETYSYLIISLLQTYGLSVDFQEQTDWQLGTDQLTPGKTGYAVIDQMISLGQQPRDHSILATDKTNRKCPQDPPKGREDDGSKRNRWQQIRNKKWIKIKENCTDFSCACGRKFSSLRGLKIHRTKIGCASQIATQEQHPVNADKTLENQSQEANHSAENIQAVGLKEKMQPKLPRIKFPPACDSEAWSMLYYAISKTLDKKQRKMKYNQQLNESSLVIYKVCKKIYSVKVWHYVGGPLSRQSFCLSWCETKQRA